MNALDAVIPPQYRAAVLAALALLYALDAIIRAIPDRVLAAHTTLEAVTNAIKWLANKTRGASAPAAALLVFLACSPASADPLPVKPSLVLPVAPAVPVVAPDVSDAARVQAALAAFNAGLLSAQAGITSTPILKPWSETKAGQIVLGCVAGAIVISSAGATTAGMLATWPR